MTTPHKYAPLAQGDGRPQKTVAAEQFWKVVLQRHSAVKWVACVVLIACFILAPIFYTSFDFSEEEQPEMQPSISPSTEEITPPQLPSTQESTPTQTPSTQEITPPRPPASNVTRPSTHEPLPTRFPASNLTKLIDFSVGGCDIWRGDWIPHPDGPTYTNATCPYIQANQDCIKNGRPDLGFLYWRWKPHDCELPLFNAKAFFKVVRGKKWIFIGDSLARNNFQSVVCSLAQVEMPVCTYNDGKGGNVHWYFRSHNFTLAVAWSPYLVTNTEDAQGIETLYLDVMDKIWASSLHNYDYIVLSGGSWYLRTSIYYEQNKLVGCHYCPTLNITDVGFGYAYKAALRNVFNYLITSKYKGVVFFRTFSPSHWENAAWDQGGNCTKKAPVESNSTTIEGRNLDIYKMQLEEFGKTLQRSSEYSFKLKIVDTIHSAILRPDAHPGPYGHYNPRVQNDCVHWCLPGAIDTWTAMLLHLVKHL